jgi:hypothetical protein
VSETINMSDGTATRWNDTVYIITNLVRSLRSASDGKCITLNISDTLLVLWYLLQMYAWVFICWFDVFRFRFKKPSALLSFDVKSLMCLSHLRLDCTVIPRYLA